jgi:outer membrane lipoprotein-sorting protein
MRSLLSVALVVIGGIPLLGQQPLSPGDIKNLLTEIRNLHTTSPDVQMDFREERFVRLMNKPVITSGKIWYQAPSKFRREVRGNSPSVTVSDGQQLWIYYPNFKSAEHYSLAKRSPVNAAMDALTAALNLENVETSYQVTGFRTGPPRPGYELDLVPKTASARRVFQRFKLRMSDELFVTGTEILQSNGDRILTSYSDHSRAAIPASIFDFRQPPGTEITIPLGR